MIQKTPRIAVVEMVLVAGLVGSIIYLLTESEQVIWTALTEAIGHSKLIGLALVTALSTYIIDRLVPARFMALGFAVIFSTVFFLGKVPINVWASLLLCVGVISAIRGSMSAPAVIALGILGLYISMKSGQLPNIITTGLRVDINLTAILLKFFGRAIEIRDYTLIVEGGLSLRLIEPCSSIWPILTVAGATGSALGLLKIDNPRSACILMGLGALLAMGLNLSRLAIMSTSSFAYNFLHEGTGAILFRVLILGSVVLSIYCSILWSRTTDNS